MKKIICFVVCACLSFAVLDVFAAEDKELNSYTINYNTETDDVIEKTTESGYSEALEVNVTKTRPVRDGYEFLGWSYKPQDYVNDPIIQPGQEIEISDSIELFAIWRDLNKGKISYLDSQREILPAQLVELGEHKISELVPQKDGYTFSGWSFSDDKGSHIIMPGEIIEIKKNVVLVACWERGSAQKPELTLRETVPGAAYFGCENADIFGGVVLNVSSADEKTESSYLMREGRVKVDDLEEGAYEAWVSAEKYGIEYVSNKVNFVISSGEESVDGPLTVFMDGIKLSFDLDPVLLEGNTYVTLRYFCEYLGADVLWENESRSAIITYNGTRMKIKENSDVCVVDGMTYKLPAPTVIMSSRMFIPLRSVAELCNCEVIWDPSRKVYMFSDKRNAFDRNLFTISENNELFLGLEDGKLKGIADVGPETMWIFNTVDENLGIYEVYNLDELTKPLEVERSEIVDGQDLRIWEKSGYDGYLWKVTECGKGEYFIQPANNHELYLDARNMCITNEVSTVFLQAVCR